MKQLEEILKQQPVYLNDWKDGGRFQVIADFENIYISKDEYEAAECPIPNKEYWIEKKSTMDARLPYWKDINILFASYGCANYSGDAWVLFERDGKLFEVNASHCSCYGVEGQWDEQETFLPALEHRLINGSFGNDTYSGNEFAKELREFLGISQPTLNVTPS